MLRGIVCIRHARRTLPDAPRNLAQGLRIAQRHPGIATAVQRRAPQHRPPIPPRPSGEDSAAIILDAGSAGAGAVPSTGTIGLRPSAPSATTSIKPRPTLSSSRRIVQRMARNPARCREFQDLGRGRWAAGPPRSSARNQAGAQRSQHRDRAVECERHDRHAPHCVCRARCRAQSVRAARRSTHAGSALPASASTSAASIGFLGTKFNGDLRLCRGSEEARSLFVYSDCRDLCPASAVLPHRSVEAAHPQPRCRTEDCCGRYPASGRVSSSPWPGGRSSTRSPTQCRCARRTR